MLFKGTEKLQGWRSKLTMDQIKHKEYMKQYKTMKKANFALQ